MTEDTLTLDVRVAQWWQRYVVPLVAWLKDMTQGEKLLLLAVLCFGAVGAQSTFQFYEPSRGLFALFPATGIELLYIGAAGAAVKRPGQRWLAYLLMGIGAIGSAYFGVMVSLRESLPGLFGVHDEVATGVVTMPTVEQWWVFGLPSLVEGVIPALATLLLSIFLHSAVSHRLMDADDKERQIQVRRDMKPFACPFCSFSSDTPAKLWGHYGRCPDALADARPSDDKRAIVQKAVAEGHERLVRG